jgi:hypothetical protein
MLIVRIDFLASSTLMRPYAALRRLPTTATVSPDLTPNSFAFEAEIDMVASESAVGYG